MDSASTDHRGASPKPQHPGGAGEYPDLTYGAVHGLDLCFRLLAPVNRDAVPAADEADCQPVPRARSGGKVIVKQPTFCGALDLCRLHGLAPVGVPLGRVMEAELQARLLSHGSPRGSADRGGHTEIG